MRSVSRFKSIVALAILGAVVIPLNAWAEKTRIGIVLDKGGKDDKSFNSAAFKGGREAEEKLGVRLKVVEATDDNAFEPNLREFAQKKFDLVIGVGFAQKEALANVAKKHPETHFALVDAEVDLPNVRSLMFEEHEGSYLVGMIAALKSKTGKIGFVGGMDIPLIRRFELGYRSGAQKVNPKIKVVQNYIGVTGDAWNNPPKAKEIALNQYKGDVDVIFVAAGASGMGVIEAADQTKKFVIGVDSNQNWIKPGRVLTSMEKRVDVAVFDTIKQVTEKKFKGGVVRYGLANEGVKFSLDEHNKSLLTDSDLKKVNQAKDEIIAKKITVPDFYKTGK